MGDEVQDAAGVRSVDSGCSPTPGGLQRMQFHFFGGGDRRAADHRHGAGPIFITQETTGSRLCVGQSGERVDAS